MHRRAESAYCVSGPRNISQMSEQRAPGGWDLAEPVSLSKATVCLGQPQTAGRTGCPLLCEKSARLSRLKPPVYFLTVSVGQEFRGSLAGWFRLRVSPEMPGKMWTTNEVI